MQSHIFPRHTKADLATAYKGDGCYLIDSHGKQYLDGSGGAAVSCLGHNNKFVIDAIKDQLDKFAFAHTGFFTSEPAEILATLLIENAPGTLDRVYFVSGGSEAVEAALKLARQYYVERGELTRNKVIARKQSYHGNTLGALAAGGNEWRRQQFSPLLIETSHVPPCYEYRRRSIRETPEDYSLRAANELETEIFKLGPDNVMAFIAEPVVGATAGAVPATPKYFKYIREICDKYGILLILDEVMCGMGRTGTLYACEQDDVSPDILCMAKGLGAGYQPIGAMLCSAQIYDTIKNGSGFFQHGHTYMGHPMACAAGQAVLNYMVKEDLVNQVNIKGQALKKILLETFEHNPYIGDIRGRGLFLGLELVQDKETKQPFPCSMQLHKMIKKIAFEEGLICYPMGGTIDGKNGDHILLAPPFIIEEHQLDELVSKLKTAIDKATETY